MNHHPRQSPLDTPPQRSNADSTAQLSESKIAKLLSECLEEARGLQPSSSASAVPLTRDPETDGPFTTVCKLASGNTATLYLAVDQRAGAAERLVVVKHFLPTFTQSEGFSARFSRQLSLARTANHPCVCKLYDYGRTNSSYYVTTEFLQGEPLSNALAAPALRNLGNRSPRLLAHLIANFAAGLHALHTLKGAVNPVHGDVTTENLFVLYDGQVRVANFGTAWIHELSQKRAPNDKSYLAPEQLEGGAIDPRADIWALGVVLWELLTGKKLFHCTTNLEAVVEILARPIPSPSTDNPRVTSELERIVLKALARDPNERYRSARELSLALEEFVAHTGGPVAQSEVAAWLTKLFPNGTDRCLGMLELADTVPTPVARAADSFASAPPVSYAYTPAAEDEVENTTQVYPPKVDESTLRSLEWPRAGFTDGPTETLRSKRATELTWRTTVAPFGASFAIVLLGFLAGHQTLTRARAGSSPTAAPTVEFERKAAPPVAATFALKPTVDEPPPVANDEKASEPVHVDFDADEEAVRSPPPASKIASHSDGTAPRIAHTPPSTPSALTAQPGAVYVTTPGGGDVYERGRYLGHAPAEFELSPGWHTLLVKSGNEDRAATVNVPAGSAIVVGLPATKP